MQITPELVARIAELSRLDLSPVETAEIRSHFEKILRYVESLDGLDTAAVDPSIFPLDAANVVAADRVEPSLSQEEALENAPAQHHGFFLVPRIL
jgi:aspartyl-tRNA(Asn)/glutamyl-tRNA(Gln) amidotransferase subunit C